MPEMLDRCVEHCGDRITVADIGLNDQRLAPLRRNSIRGLLRLIFTFSIVDDDIRAVLRQTYGGASTDTTGRTGDQCHFTFKLHKVT